jgi:hypothetical protein
MYFNYITISKDIKLYFIQYNIHIVIFSTTRPIQILIQINSIPQLHYCTTTFENELKSRKFDAKTYNIYIEIYKNYSLIISLYISLIYN